MSELMEKVRIFFAENPQYFGIVLVVFAIVLLLSAIYNAHWLFGETSGSNYDLGKIDGWVNIFGRRTARIMVGVLSVLVAGLGIVWFWLYTIH